MARISDIFVSVVFVMDDQILGASGKVKSLSKILRGLYTNYEILIIDNGIYQKEYRETIKLLENIPCIRIIRLSRTHDTDTAIFAGIDASIGDYVCILYNNDPIDLLPKFIDKAQRYDLVFGSARNLRRQNKFVDLGAGFFYWYSKHYLKINIPKDSTYFICMNRVAVNALTKSGRYMRHIRHMATQVGFRTTYLTYSLPKDNEVYSRNKQSSLIFKAIDLISNYSSHPLKILSYFGIFAGLLNIGYAAYVVIVNISQNNIAKGWTTLSLQSSLMFFILFMLLAVLSEYIGKILNEVQHEPSYHISDELSSSLNIADETRRNVVK